MEDGNKAFKNTQVDEKTAARDRWLAIDREAGRVVGQMEVTRSIKDRRRARNRVARKSRRANR